MNTLDALGQLNNNALGLGTAERLYRRPDEAMRNWQPEHAPKVESLTAVLNAALSVLRDTLCPLNSCRSKIGILRELLNEKECAVDKDAYNAVEAASELRKLAERIKKLATDLDERL